MNEIPLPENWPPLVRSAMIHICALAHHGIVCSRSMCTNSHLQHHQVAGKLERSENKLSMVEEELDLLRSRLARVPARLRPHYTPFERMRIVMLRVMRGWNLTQTAEHFLVEPETVSKWHKRIDDGSGLLAINVPVNKFPEFVRFVVQRLKVLCPTMGKKRIAEVLSACGLYLCATTVGRLIKQPLSDEPDALVESPLPESKPARVVTARHPNHVWHVDLTVVPTSGGLWTPWFPFTLPQKWPFAYWVAVIIDQFSRRAMGFAIFLNQASAHDIKCFLSRTIRRTGEKPRHLISDKGSQFTSDEFRKYCKRKGIRQRFGAVGKYGSIAIVERFIRSMKDECTRRITIPLNMDEMRTELSLYLAWYNEYRPHQTLNGLTPYQRYQGLSPPKPLLNSLIKEHRDVKLELRVSYLEGRRHLPIVELKQAA